jgi:glycosyltransferase involved in cell wall biosynthesis
VLVKALAEATPGRGPVLEAAARLPGLSVVLPCRDERDNVAAAVAEARAAAWDVAHRLEVIVVDDGSRDGTGEIAAFLARSTPELRLVTHSENRGYGAAVRSGIGAATMPWILLTDAALQFDLRELDRFARRASGADLVVGRRARRADPLGRRLAGVGWNVLVRRLFGLPVRDVDCAFKLMRASLVQTLELTADGAMVSAELLGRAVAAGAAVHELDVTHRPRAAGEQSGASPRVIARALRELVALAPALRSP